MIPTISLTSIDTKELASLLRKTCIEYGFFYLVDHGIDEHFMKQVFHQSKLLFDLDVKEKKALSDPKTSRGYTAMEEETLDPMNQSKGDTKEGYYIGRDVPKNDPRYNPAKLSAPNIWPSKDSGMEDPSLFKETMEQYHARATDVSLKVVKLLALSLGLEEHFFDESFVDPMASLRLLHYKAETSVPDKGIFACGAHSDYGMLTLLATDSNPGLQILTKQGEWMDVPPKENAFVVNLGDMLERWSNGLYKSTVHRVLTSGTSERYSMPFFFEPAFDTVVKCLDVCCSESKPPQYPPTTSGEFLLNKYKQTHADFDPKS